MAWKGCTTSDEKLAVGAATGGAASVIGHGATTIVAKALALKVGGAGAAKAGAALALTNPVVGGVCLVGGLCYIMWKCRSK